MEPFDKYDIHIHKHPTIESLERHVHMHITIGSYIGIYNHRHAAIGSSHRDVTTMEPL